MNDTREAFEKWWHDEYLKYQPIDLVYASDTEKTKPAVYKIWSIGYQAAQAEQAKQEPVLLNNMSNSQENVQAYLKQSVHKGMAESFGALMKSPNIDEIVSRFLSWKLPTDFSPDGGISFETRYLPSSPHWVIGTNLFTADQAKAMFEHVLKGSHSEIVTSPPNQSALIAELVEASRAVIYTAPSHVICDQVHHPVNMRHKSDEKCPVVVAYNKAINDLINILAKAAPTPNTVDKAAYDGAREDLAIWKKRALEAENKVKIYDQRIVDIGAIAMNPVKVKQPPNTITIPVDEYERLKKDAERYRYIRQSWDFNIGVPFITKVNTNHVNAIYYETADEAIDKARSEP